MSRHASEITDIDRILDFSINLKKTQTNPHTTTFSETFIVLLTFLQITKFPPKAYMYECTP